MWFGELVKVMTAIQAWTLGTTERTEFFSLSQEHFIDLLQASPFDLNGFLVLLRRAARKLLEQLFLLSTFVVT